MALPAAMLASSSDSLFVKYGKAYDIPPALLWGIAKQESNFNPHAVNKNKNGTYDMGLMQINSIHLKMLDKEGIKAKDLFNPETNVAVAAFILSECLKKHGNNWKGLTCYNGRIERNSYATQVLKKIAREIKKHEQADYVKSNIALASGRNR